MSSRDTTQRNRDRATLARTKAACAICGQPIDYTLTTIPNQHGPRCHNPQCPGCKPHPLRFEADHIIPLARGGKDELSNKQTTHRQCNNRKRARLIAPIVRRSGSLTQGDPPPTPHPNTPLPQPPMPRL